MLRRRIREKYIYQFFLYLIFVFDSWPVPASWSSGNAFVSGAGGLRFKISGRSNRTQCCQRLATAVTFSSEGAVLPGRNDVEMGAVN